MSTKSFSKSQVTHNWYVVDVAGIPLGRAASRIATILRGKHKPFYTPHDDVGDFVIALNVAKAKLTGKKLEREVWRWHTGYLGHLRERPLSEMMAKKPEYMFWKAVRGMLPRGPLGRAMLRKLKIYSGPDHPHQAQQPKPLDLTKNFLEL